MENISQKELGLLRRLLTPARKTLSPEGAKEILKLRFDPTDVRRMNRLAARARLGSLNAKECEEIEIYDRWGHFLAMLHSRARRSLNTNPHE